MPPRAADLLAPLVRVPSVNPMGRDDVPPELAGEARAVDHLESVLRAHGVIPVRIPAAPGRDNLLAEFRPAGDDRPALLWEAHVDTVPVDGMTVDPFGAEVRDGRLYGRGACDVKAGAAAMLAAFLRLTAEKPAGARPVQLAFAVDEEHAQLGVRALAASGQLRAWGAVVAEPTRLRMVAAHKGVTSWRIEVPGVAAHASRPERGVSAVYRAARIIAGVEAFAAELARRTPDPLLGVPTVSVGTVRGGASPNTVPDFCAVEIDRRLLPGESASAAPAELEAFLRSLPGVDFPFTTVAPRAGCPPLPAAGAERLRDELGLAIQAVTGAPAVTESAPYGTDASTLALAGIPAVVFGPGDIAQAHTKDEWVELSEVEAAAEILYRLACAA